MIATLTRGGLAVRGCRAGVARALVVLLAACSSGRPKPTPLDSLTPKIAGRMVWQAKVQPIGFPLGVAVRDGRFHVAGGDGTTQRCAVLRRISHLGAPG